MGRPLLIASVLFLLAVGCTAGRVLQEQQLPGDDTPGKIGDIRLVPCLNSEESPLSCLYPRLEIFQKGNGAVGKWGSICNNVFTQLDAEKACTQLLNTPYIMVEVGTAEPKAGAPVWAASPNCTKQDSDFTSCSGINFKRAPITTKACVAHEKDVGLFCLHADPLLPPPAPRPSPKSPSVSTCNPAQICPGKSVGKVNYNLRNLCDASWKTYVTCTNGKFVKVKTCPKGQLYNAIKHKCLAAGAQPAKPAVL